MLARYTFPFSSSKGRVRQVLSVLFSACLFFLCIVCLVKHAVKYVSIFYHRSFQKEFPKPRIHSFKFLIFNSNKFIKFLIRDHPLNNLFTTSNPPNIRIPILQIFVFVIEGGQENKDLENWNSNIWRVRCREQVKRGIIFNILNI